MNKLSKRLCIFLSVILLFSGVTIPGEISDLSTVSAAESTYDTSEVDNYYTGDLEKAKGYKLAETFVSKNQTSGYQTAHVPASYYGASYTYNWGGYGSTYYYSKLSSKEKKFYNKLKQVALQTLNNKSGYKNSYASFSGAYGYYYYMEPQVASGLSEASAIRVMNVFSYSNPQYYFYDHGYIYGTNSDGDKVYALTLYSKFKTGSTRLSATKSFNKTLKSWVKQIKSKSGYIKKIQKAQALICNKVKYATSTYDQSAYSVFCGKKTVCAGYSSAFCILCEASGIDTLVLTSALSGYEHEWNMVKIHGNWYYMDVTWDDLDKQYDINGDGKKDSYYYEYMLRNKKNFIYDSSYKYSGDLTSKYSHTPESYWKKYGIPSANYDTSPSASANYSKVGSIKTLAKPSGLTVKKVSSGVKVTWKKVSGAKYYIIQRKVGSGSWKTIKAKTTSLKYTDKSVKSGKTYYYRVTAMKTTKTAKNYCSAKKIKYKK
ncbi:MAG: hypothetical protein K5675_05110 [Lachnospiraceae bacterium]|nr:hypothetical protein [Lachnospiraceae bacterium]